MRRQRGEASLYTWNREKRKSPAYVSRSFGSRVKTRMKSQKISMGKKYFGRKVEGMSYKIVSMFRDKHVLSEKRGWGQSGV
jgi:hypothetical protein